MKKSKFFYMLFISLYFIFESSSINAIEPDKLIKTDITPDESIGVRLPRANQPSIGLPSLNLGNQPLVPFSPFRQDIREMRGFDTVSFNDRIKLGRRSLFKSRFQNTAVGDSNILESSLNGNVNAFCDHLISGKKLDEKPAGCNFDGASALDNCDLGGVITNRELVRMQRVLAELPANKKKESCFENLKSIAASTLTVSGDIVQATIQSATNITEIPNFDTGTSAQNCVSQFVPGKFATCDDFSDTPLAGANLSGFMSKFIIDFDGFGNITKYFKLRGTTGECESCFGDKYVAIQKQFNQPSDNFQAEYIETLAKAKLNLRVRKAEQAFSEYIKFRERNMFMSRFLNAQEETCESIPELEKLKRGCDPEQAQKVLDILARRHKVKSYSNDLPSFLDSLTKTHLSKLSEPVNVPECGEGMRVTHPGYLSMYQTQIGTPPMQPSLLFGADTISQLKRCQEYDQGCMLGVLRDSLTKINNGNQEVAKKLVDKFFRQPFYRSLLTHRDSLIDYASTGDLSEGNSLSKYKETNKDLLSEIANRDSKVACKSFGNDLMMAICVSDSDLGKSYSGQGLKEELADMLATNGPTEPGEAGRTAVNLTVACNMLNAAGNLNSEIHESQAISDKSFDRLELADSFLRNNIRQPSRLSQKKNAFITNYAKKMCDDAIEENNRQDRALFAALNQPESSVNKPKCARMYGVINFTECAFENVFFEPSPVLDLTDALPTSNIGLKKYLPTQSSSIKLPLKSDSYDFADYTESARGTVGFTSSSMSLIPKTIGIKPEVSEETVETGGFLQNAFSMATSLTAPQTQPVAIAPLWNMPIPDATTASSGIGSVLKDGEEIGPDDRRRGASERSIQEIEARQMQVEQQLLAQARDTQTIQDLKNQSQIEQLRVELQRLQLSNKQLMTNIQRLSAPRKTQSEDNIFDQADEEVEDTVEASEPVATRPVSRGVAQTAVAKPDAPSSVARSAIDGSSVTSSSTRLPAQSNTEKAATSSSAAVAANVGLVRGGTQAAATRGAVSNAGSSFVPSMSLQRTISPETTQEVIPQEKKIELLKEFLSYVEKNPEYRDGRYLSSENDRVTIEYEGRTVILSVTDIQDNKARAHLQERLLRQRMVINQYVRASRLENLKRLLASTRAQP